MQSDVQRDKIPYYCDSRSINIKLYCSYIDVVEVHVEDDVVYKIPLKYLNKMGWETLERNIAIATTQALHELMIKVDK